MTEIFPEGYMGRGGGAFLKLNQISFCQVTASELLHSVTEHGYALTDDEVI